MKLIFTKMHGIGNDFIVVDAIHNKLPNLRPFARPLCNRRTGIGADQLLILKKSRKADFRMEIYNADGGRVEMCGNGLRCLARYLHDEQITARRELTIETLAGVQKARILSKKQVRVDMGEPILRGKEIPVNLAGRVINRIARFNEKEYRITCVSMGNPHCVIFVEDLKDFPVKEIGPIIERSSLFPRRVNIEFVKILSRGEIQMRVWERGAGETPACGSGACAAVVASVLNGKTDTKVDVKLPGGVLQIEWNKKLNHVFMTGPAETVFEGEAEV